MMARYPMAKVRKIHRITLARAPKLRMLTSSSWITQEKLSFGVGVWLTHVLVLGLALYMLRKRLTLPRFSFSKLVARLRGGKTA